MVSEVGKPFPLFESGIAARGTRRPIVSKIIRLALVATGFLLAVGCQEDTLTTRTKRSRFTAQPAQDHLSRALEYLERIDEFDEQTARAQAVFQLNRWLDSQKPDPDWKPDEMVSRLPRTVRERGVLEDLTGTRFNDEDVRAFQEAIWMRQLSHWVSRQPLDPLFGDWLESQKSQLEPGTVEQLAAAHRLFDWIIRNIQLNEQLPSPDESTAAPAAGTGPSQALAVVPAALRGIPGPGYLWEPTQNLMFGQADEWQRMRLFTLMARQQGMDVVTLAFPGKTIPPRPRPWVSALLLQDQLYLFDMRLGIPIPGKAGVGVVTLKEVLADPTLLKNLEIDEAHPYRIDSGDLEEVVALLDVVAAHLSQRTDLVEKQLVGEHRTVLTVPISAKAGKLRASPGIRDVYLWSIPFEASWYRAVVNQRVRNDEQAAAQYFAMYGMFLNRTPLARGRIAYLRGEIENDDERQGAKALFMQARVPRDQLDELNTNEEVQKLLGVARDPRSNEQQWAMQMEVFKNVLTRSKQCASLWLGLCQLESGKPEAAIPWFQTRSLDAWPDGHLAPLARYNLARTYEALGKIPEAQRVLLADKSIQEHGNYLRAQMLEKSLAKSESAKGEGTAAEKKSEM